MVDKFFSLLKEKMGKNHTSSFFLLPSSLKSRRGFTLVEMLVVIGILAILIGVGVSSFSGSTKNAQKAQAQELVSEVATALEAIYQNDDGVWPRRILAKSNSEDGLNEEVAYVLAKRNIMSLTYNDTDKKTVGSDRFGIVSPWAQRVIGRNVGKGIGSGTKVPSGGTIKDHVIRYAVDDNGDGFVDANVGGVTVHIRASAVAWCCGFDGVISPYPLSGGGGGSGGKGSSAEGSSGSRSDDVYSWSRQQVVNK